jgi:hypothetical protein
MTYQRNIKTFFVQCKIPTWENMTTRRHSWLAIFDDQEAADYKAWGRTEQEAIENLLEEANYV